MQNGPAYAIVAFGAAVIVTEVVPAGLVHPFTVAVTVYVPASASVTEEIVGVWAEDVNPFGPVHAYVAPATFVAERFNEEPSQTGPLLEAVGAAGMGFTVTVVATEVAEHPFASVI